VVDNLETVSNAREILVRLQRMLGPSRLLLTSRERVPGDYFHASLRGLSLDSSLVFMRREGRMRNAVEVAEADAEILCEIHEATQGMPLAMKLVIGQVEVLGLGVALDNLKKGQGDIYSFIFLSSWTRLSEVAKNMLLYLGPSPGLVERDELKLALEVEGTSLDWAIQELTELSLLSAQPSPDLLHRGYSIHQLTRYFVVNDLPQYWMEQGLI